MSNMTNFVSSRCNRSEEDRIQIEQQQVHETGSIHRRHDQDF